MAVPTVSVVHETEARMIYRRRWKPHVVTYPVWGLLSISGMDKYQQAVMARLLDTHVHPFTIAHAGNKLCLRKPSYALGRWCFIELYACSQANMAEAGHGSRLIFHTFSNTGACFQADHAAQV